MSISPLSGSRENSDELKEAGHLVMPKIPLPRELDESRRDKGAKVTSSINEHLIPNQYGQTSDDSGQLLWLWC